MKWGEALLQRPTAVHQPAPELSGSRTDLLCPVAQLGWDLLLPVPSAGSHLWLRCPTSGHVASAQALASLPSGSGAGQGRGREGLKPLAPRSAHTVAECPVSVAFLTVYKINSLPAVEMQSHFLCPKGGAHDPCPLNPSLISGTGPLQLDCLAGLQRWREDGLLGPGYLRGHRCHLLR